MIVKDTLDDELHQAKVSQGQIGAALDTSDDYSVSTNPSRLPDEPEGDCSSVEDSEDEESTATKPNHLSSLQSKIQDVSLIGCTDYHSRSATLLHEWVSPKPRTSAR